MFRLEIKGVYLKDSFNLAKRILKRALEPIEVASIMRGMVLRIIFTIIFSRFQHSRFKIHL